jgi:hypothetical protein
MTPSLSFSFFIAQLLLGNVLIDPIPQNTSLPRPSVTEHPSFAEYLFRRFLQLILLIALLMRHPIF